MQNGKEKLSLFLITLCFVRVKTQILSGMQGDGEAGTLNETEQTINLVHLRSPTARSPFSVLGPAHLPNAIPIWEYSALEDGEVRLVHDAELSRWWP